MYVASNYSEFIATSFNISSNLCMFFHVYKTPKESVPRVVILFQILANISWVVSSILLRDVYLATTASGSLSLQIFTMLLLIQGRMKTDEISNRKISTDNSSDKLLKF